MAQILTFKVKFDFEGQRQSAHKTIGPLGPNRVFLAWVGVELLCGQAKVLTRTDGWTHTRTDAGNANTRSPKLASGNKRLKVVTRHIDDLLDTGCAAGCQNDNLTEGQDRQYDDIVVSLSDWWQ